MFPPLVTPILPPRSAIVATLFEVALCLDFCIKGCNKFSNCFILGKAIFTFSLVAKPKPLMGLIIPDELTLKPKSYNLFLSVLFFSKPLGIYFSKLILFFFKPKPVIPLVSNFKPSLVSVAATILSPTIFVSVR